MNDFNNEFQNDDELQIKKQTNSPSKDKEGLKFFLKYFLIGIIIVAVFTAGYLTHYASMDPELKSINFILNAYKNNYYQAQDKDKTDLIVDALMDEYSEFYTKEEYQQVIQSGNGERAGYGFAINEQMVIVQVVWNSPAERVGLAVGDKVNGYKKNNQAEYVTATTNQAFNDYLTSCTTSDTLDLLIERNSQPLSLKMQKEEYTETYVRYSDNTGNYSFLGEGSNISFQKVEGENLALSSGWAYLKLSRFYGRLEGLSGAEGQFKRALEQFKNNGNKKLIIDLRSNGGGYMSILCDIASHLCYDGESDGKSLVCQVAIYKSGRKEEFKTKATDYLTYGFEKIVFLANSGSASASEALMGAVLDYDKKSGNNIVNVVLDPTQTNDGTVYKTYGKGIMQSTISNTFTGEALKLTTAQIYWPVYNTSIHGIGLTPETDPRILATNGDAISFAQTL